MCRFALVFLLMISMNVYSAETLRFVFDSSRIYPDTQREIIVTVPDSYTGSVPAALYVGLDGILCNAPAVIDSLIAKGEMPVTIGVFVQPGVVKNSSGEVVRYNRSNEFDAVDGTFASFLEQELLPAVEKLTLNDGRNIRISSNPDDRMIFGLSSGGIAAFGVCWHRPDLFRRVFSGCGTFVPMRGGDSYQTLVRKTEPKPLRIFLQDGYSDTWNPLFGSWYEANRMLASALEFAGYDIAADWAEGGHSVRRANEIFTDVMRWIWRDYPARLESGVSGNSLLADILPADSISAWERILPESNTTPVEAVYPDSSFIVRPVPGTNWLEQALMAQEGGEYAVQRFYYLQSATGNLLEISGMDFDSNGNLWVLTSEGVMIADQNGRVRVILPLPLQFEPGDAGNRLKILPGELRAGNFRRKLNVSPAMPGVRPASQGQG